MSDEFKDGKEEGLLIGKVDAMARSIDELKMTMNNFITGTGQRMHEGEVKMGVHDTDIIVLKTSVKDLVDAKKWVVTSILGVVLLAIIGLVIKR